MSGMEDRDDPGADTAMFRAYVEQDDPGPGATNRTALIGVAVAVAVAVLVVLAILLLA
ncbi:MAG: hypothetical protein ACRDZN_13775 [Acidimicrobiales bacterium]